MTTRGQTSSCRPPILSAPSQPGPKPSHHWLPATGATAPPAATTTTTAAATSVAPLGTRATATTCAAIAIANALDRVSRPAVIASPPEPTSTATATAVPQIGAPQGQRSSKPTPEHRPRPPAGQQGQPAVHPHKRGVEGESSARKPIERVAELVRDPRGGVEREQANRSSGDSPRTRSVPAQRQGPHSGSKPSLRDACPWTTAVDRRPRERARETKRPKPTSRARTIRTAPNPKRACPAEVGGGSGTPPGTYGPYLSPFRPPLCYLRRMTLPPIDQRDHAQAAYQLMETVLTTAGHDMSPYDVLAMAQVSATLAVWAELKRANDNPYFWVPPTEGTR